eukprot:jgi/Tetstr1/455996/TSEL_042774.t1
MKASLTPGQSPHENLLDFMTRLEDLQIVIKDCDATVSDDDMLVSRLNSTRAEEATVRAVVKGDPTVITFKLAKAKIRTIQDHNIGMEQPGVAFAAFAPAGATSYVALHARATELEAEKATAEAATRKTSHRTMITAVPSPPLSSHNPFGSLTFSDDNAGPDDKPTLLEKREMRDAIAVVPAEEQAMAVAVAAVAEEEAAERAAIADVATFIAADPLAMTVARSH